MKTILNWENPTQSRVNKAKEAAKIATGLGWNGRRINGEMAQRVLETMTAAGRISNRGKPYTVEAIQDMLKYIRRRRGHTLWGVAPPANVPTEKEPQVLSRVRTDNDRETLKLIKIVINSQVGDGQKVKSVRSLLDHVELE